MNSDLEGPLPAQVQSLKSEKASMGEKPFPVRTLCYAFDSDTLQSIK